MLVSRKSRRPNKSHNEPNASHNQPNASHNYPTQDPTRGSGIWFALGLLIEYGLYKTGH